MDRTYPTNEEVLEEDGFDEEIDDPEPMKSPSPSQPSKAGRGIWSKNQKKIILSHFKNHIRKKWLQRRKNAKHC